MIKILFVHHGSGLGGAPINLLNFIKTLDRNRYYPIVLFLQKSNAMDYFKEYGMEYVYYKDFNHHFVHSEAGWNRIKNIRNIKEIISVIIQWFYVAFNFGPKVLKEINPDIVHLNSSVLSSWAVASKTGSKKYPLIVHVQEPLAKGYFKIRMNLMRFIFKHFADGIIAISEDNAKRIDLPKKTRVVYNLINNIADGSNNRLEKPLGQKDEKKVLYLGGTHTIKGFDVLVDSLAYLDEKVIVVFAGHYDENEKRLHVIKESKNAALKGFIAIEDVPKYLMDCEFVVFPSTVPHFARPIIEASFYSKPAIASNVEGMSELIEDGVTGKLVTPGDSRELAKAINFLCKNKSIVDEMGRNANKKFINIIDTRLNSGTIIQMYEDILEQSKQESAKINKKNLI